eukprot:436997-Amphidinium_carterae.1
MNNNNMNNNNDDHDDDHDDHDDDDDDDKQELQETIITKTRRTRTSPTNAPPGSTVHHGPCHGRGEVGPARLHIVVHKLLSVAQNCQVQQRNSALAVNRQPRA